MSKEDEEKESIVLYLMLLILSPPRPMIAPANLKIKRKDLQNTVLLEHYLCKVLRDNVISAKYHSALFTSANVACLLSQDNVLTFYFKEKHRLEVSVIGWCPLLIVSDNGGFYVPKRHSYNKSSSTNAIEFCRFSLRWRNKTPRDSNNS